MSCHWVRPQRHCKPRRCLSALAALGLPGLAVLALLAPACGSDPKVAARVLTGDRWIPSVAGASSSNHDPNVAITSNALIQTSGALTGLGQGWSGREITVSIDMTQDLGAYGSVTLLAQTTGFPASLQGGAYPILTYLSDGTNEYLNLTRAGGADCAGAGAFTCSGGSCSNNASCTVNWPSAYFDRSHWQQHQLNVNFASYISVNTFPSCNWTGTTNPGTAGPYSNPQCAFNTNFFVAGKLRSGVTYTAKYVLLTDSYSSLNGYNAGLQVSVIRKSKSSVANPGAIDVNLIFVGFDVSQASRNPKGQINLNTLMTALAGFYGAAGVNVKLGAINAYEWTDGDMYANLTTSQFGDMAAAASAIVQPSSEGKAVNIFLVKSVSDNSSLLGESGGIGGPMLNGLRNSGVVVSTFGRLDQFNVNCSAAPCSLQQVDADFDTLEQTIAHEMGHYLGLNHPSESTGTYHDVVPDTPMCTATGSSGNISIGSCLNTDTNIYGPTGKKCNQSCTTYDTLHGIYCPAAAECQFNYMMYWSSKYFTEGTGAGDGSIFSANEGTVMNYCPLIQ